MNRRAVWAIIPALGLLVAIMSYPSAVLALWPWEPLPKISPVVLPTPTPTPTPAIIQFQPQPNWFVPLGTTATPTLTPTPTSTPTPTPSPTPIETVVTSEPTATASPEPSEATSAAGVSPSPTATGRVLLAGLTSRETGLIGVIVVLFLVVIILSQWTKIRQWLHQKTA